MTDNPEGAPAPAATTPVLVSPSALSTQVDTAIGQVVQAVGGVLLAYGVFTPQHWAAIAAAAPIVGTALWRIWSAILAAAQQAQHDWRVPASVSLAQWALESGWGDKMPIGSLNPFGVKARPGEPAVVCLTHESVHGQMVEVHAAFRRFDTLGQAFDRHAELLATSPIYAPAMKVLPDLAAFVRLMGAHYATDPDYAGKLLAVIQGSGMARYDVAPPSQAPSGHDVLRAALSSPGDHP